jgi:hypothetical protein
MYTNGQLVDKVAVDSKCDLKGRVIQIEGVLQNEQELMCKNT